MQIWGYGCAGEVTGVKVVLIINYSSIIRAKSIIYVPKEHYRIDITKCLPLLPGNKGMPNPNVILQNLNLISQFHNSTEH